MLDRTPIMTGAMRDTIAELADQGYQPRGIAKAFAAAGKIIPVRSIADSSAYRHALRARREAAQRAPVSTSETDRAAGFPKYTRMVTPQSVTWMPHNNECTKVPVSLRAFSWDLQA